MAGRPLASYVREYPNRGERIRSRLQTIAAHGSHKARTRDLDKIARHEAEICRLRDLHQQDLLGLLP
jgi:hypothetical protein